MPGMRRIQGAVVSLRLKSVVVRIICIAPLLATFMELATSSIHNARADHRGRLARMQKSGAKEPLILFYESQASRTKEPVNQQAK